MGIFGKPEHKPAEAAVPSRAPSPVPAPSPSAVPPAAVPAPRPSAGVCVVGAKTTFKGEISGDEDILVEGVVEGQIHITKDLRVGPGGVVEAKVQAQSVVVSGEMVGRLPRPPIGSRSRPRASCSATSAPRGW